MMARSCSSFSRVCVRPVQTSSASGSHRRGPDDLAQADLVGRVRPQPQLTGQQARAPIGQHHDRLRECSHFILSRGPSSAAPNWHGGRGVVCALPPLRSSLHRCVVCVLRSPFSKLIWRGVVVTAGLTRPHHTTHSRSIDRSIDQGRVAGTGTDPKPKRSTPNRSELLALEIGVGVSSSL